MELHQFPNERKADTATLMAAAIRSLYSMKSLEQKLPENKFMRVHRSFIVNLNRIQIVERMRIVFGNVYIPVGDQYKEKFQEFLDKNFL